MHASVIIIAHNEGDRLWKTVRSCVENPPDCQHEIIVVDDASEDNSIDELMRRYPTVRLVKHERRRGVAPARNTGSDASRGDILVFIDAHCHPERDAFSRLVTDVEQCDGEAIIAPRIALLDEDAWTNSPTTGGNGYALDLKTFEQEFVQLHTLRRRGRFYESPNLVGCFAISRDLYMALGGCDAAMCFWGSEQVDLGLKAWLLGYSVLNDLDAVLGHRFQTEFTDYRVPDAHIVANEIRTAYKHFSDDVWHDWLQRYQQSKEATVWRDAWQVFSGNRASADKERAALFSARERDEFWYAHEFDMEWPLQLASRSKIVAMLDDAAHRFGVEPRTSTVGGHATSSLGSISLFLNIGMRQWGDQDVEAVGFTTECKDLSRAGGLLVHRINHRTLKYARKISAARLATLLGNQSEAEQASQTALNALHDALRQLRCNVEAENLVPQVSS